MARERPNPVRGVLFEEAVSVRRKIAAYKAALRSLPQGSLVEKKINGRSYFYLARRMGSRVRFKYLGKLGEEERSRYVHAGKKRAMYRRFLAELNAQAAYIRRAIGGRKKRSA